MNDPRLLVFDWDGTLMDSIGTIVACTQAVIRELELGELPEQTIRGTIGLGLRETVEVLVPGCDDALFETIIEAYRRHWYLTFRDTPMLFAGVEAMLRDLSEEGYLLAVATGKSRRGLDFSLEQTGLGGLFHSTRTADEAFSKDVRGAARTPPAACAAHAAGMGSIRKVVDRNRARDAAADLHLCDRRLVGDKAQ